MRVPGERAGRYVRRAPPAPGAGRRPGAGTVWRVRTLLTPRWIVLHIIVLGTLPVVLWLGWWQWRGGFQGHSLQTTGYALQWWVFAAFAILLWLRLMRDELRRQDAAAAGGPPPGAAAPPEPPAAAPYVRYRMPAAAPAVRDGSDLGRYNDFLAQLNASDAHDDAGRDMRMPASTGEAAEAVDEAVRPRTAEEHPAGDGS